MLLILLLCILSKTAIATLGIQDLPIESKKLFAPPIDEIAHVLRKGLAKNYKEVQVDVVDCPDLKEPPFTLAGAGLNGNTKILSIGDVKYLFPYANLTKVYDMRDVLQILGMDLAFIFGASSGPYQYTGPECEGVFDMSFMGEKIVQHTRIVPIMDDGSYVIKQLPLNETRFDVMADFFASEGKPGPVLRVHVQNRTGQDSYIASIRKVLTKHYGSKVVGIGGTFLLLKGNVSQTLVPDFSKTPFTVFQDVVNWLRFYNMSAPLVGIGSLVTGAYDLNLRSQHFHTFSNHEEAGHYVTDTTPEIVEYLGYFNTAEYVHRIDRPPAMNKEVRR